MFLKIALRFAISIGFCILLSAGVSKVFLGPVGMSSLYLGIFGGFVVAISRLKSTNT